MNDFAVELDAVCDDIARVRQALAGVIVGQDALLEQLLIAMFARGHVLIEGLPGLGKTHLCKAVARILGVQLGRIQCTPDLLPSDVTGSEVLTSGPAAGTNSMLEFRPGPVFANLALVDEINRATPRTQSALLEAMQEQQVTHAGTSYPLPGPFWVVATQNPIELEGTFPLPEAQLDRFLFKLDVAYPSADCLESLLQTTLDGEPADDVAPLLDAQRVLAIIDSTQEVLVSAPVRQSAIDLVLSTQPGVGKGAAVQHIRYGASPRALQGLVRAARVVALFDGRPQVDFEDLAAVAKPVLSHRLLLKTVSELDGVTVENVVDQLLKDWQSAFRD